MEEEYNPTPEERKRIIDSIPEASIIDSCKENIQPRRQGRSVSSLVRTLEMNSIERERAIQTGKNNFAKQLAILTEIDDPLDVYIQHVKWIMEMFPDGSASDDLMNVLHEATNRFRNWNMYQQDLRYLKLWIEYSKWVEEPLEIFEFLINNKIGKTTALLYKEYAYYLEGLQKYDKAIEACNFGLEVNAMPTEILEKLRDDLIARLKERQRQGLIRKREQESITQMNELRAQKRTMLGQKFDAKSRSSVSANVYAGIQSSHGSTTTQSNLLGNERFSIPSSSSSSNKIHVFQDDTSSSSQRNSSSSSLLSRNISNKSSASSNPLHHNQFRPSTSTSSASENRVTVEKFSGATIPQGEVIRPEYEKFTVYRDPEDSNLPRKKDKNNNSMLSESSTEESHTSRLRRNPINDTDETNKKKPRRNHRSEAHNARMKVLLDEFKRRRRFMLNNKDSKGKEEILAVHQTTHSQTCFEIERARSLDISFKLPKEKIKEEKEEEESGFDLYYNENKSKPLDVGYTTETRKAIASLNEMVYGSNVSDEEEEDITFTNPKKQLYPKKH